MSTSQSSPIQSSTIPSDSIKAKVDKYLTWLKACSDSMPQFTFLHQLLTTAPTHYYNQSQHFARVYDFSREPTVSTITSELTIANFPSLQSLPAGSGRLVLLRGYPDVTLLCMIAAVYNVDPEFFRRHLQFFDIPEPEKVTEDYMSSHTLPSFPKHIAQIRLPWIGIRPSGQGDRGVADTRALRSQVRRDVISYLRQLSHGAGWGPAHTYIRDCELLDQRCFVIDQRATIYFAPQDIERRFWLSKSK